MGPGLPCAQPIFANPAKSDVILRVLRPLELTPTVGRAYSPRDIPDLAFLQMELTNDLHSAAALSDDWMTWTRHDEAADDVRNAIVLGALGISKEGKKTQLRRFWQPVLEGSTAEVCGVNPNTTMLFKEHEPKQIRLTRRRYQGTFPPKHPFGLAQAQLVTQTHGFLQSFIPRYRLQADQLWYVCPANSSNLPSRIVSLPSLQHLDA
eukprot:CAMPEP_0197693242 /NCGR_PEP_ID=MMETSP1338-20131121/112202_1 /TAXON_ID=43686 ORGANISM="Pelagodinium beii, Strain RCC1491" /NCGR_SAMPLE_ID=MMETSP1338 /ASSEMBLY_ACC=CAM_ASM_000754 /LENGTH=206 /DNA_ID=CAMNT_0043275961 /DNA_START=187 /DNA_END=809 /DNA_ORIENTATION=-